MLVYAADADARTLPNAKHVGTWRADAALAGALAEAQGPSHNCRWHSIKFSRRSRCATLAG